jgi:hypothetical protein
MKVLASIDNYEKFKFAATITPRQPDSGFSMCFGNTDLSGSFKTGIRFYGSGGLVFDDDGKFFGGYQSGRSLEIAGSFFGNRMSYFYNGNLVRNNLITNGNFTEVEFEKFGDSELNLRFDFISGQHPSDNIMVDLNGIILISSDNFYILPIIE